MAAMRAPVVTETKEFTAQVEALRGEYPAINSALNEMREVLILDYALPHVPVAKYPGAYAVKLDYPPMGSGGLGRFLLTYHMTERVPHMQHPLCTFTLLTIEALP